MKRLAPCGKLPHLALVVACCGILPHLAHAAGLGRPNIVGPRAIGLGGAFTAVADDVTGVWYNPAGLAVYGDSSVYVGGDVVFLDRSYTPSADSPLGQAGVSKTIHENTGPQFTPVLGATTRFGFGKAAPSRFAFGIGVYSPYGGAISFKPSDVASSGILSTTIADIEVTPTLAYQVTDVLMVGAGLRIGIGLFDLVDNLQAAKVNQSMTGVGIGGTFGVMLRPHWRVQIGAVYRTPLSIGMSGDGPVTLAGQMQTNRSGSLNIDWPQSAGLGVAVYPHRRILVSVQGDWTGWSSVQRLDVNLDGIGPTTSYMRFRDSYALHLGVQAVFSRYVLGRIGYSIDSNAIPDRDMRRENEDAVKHTLAVGLGVHVWKMFFDAAFESFLPTGARTIGTQVGSENEAGSYDARIYSLELSAQIRF